MGELNHIIYYLTQLLECWEYKRNGAPHERGQYNRLQKLRDKLLKQQEER